MKTEQIDLSPYMQSSFPLSFFSRHYYHLLQKNAALRLLLLILQETMVSSKYSVWEAQMQWSYKLQNQPGRW